ncbi:MAG TPA: FtsX-like permease family protein [Bacilli bacterium]|nr:FtsX-like permease family protein [Bacilli bacterium]
MKKFTKLIFRETWTLFPKLLAIVLIVALGVGFTLGLMTAAPNLHYSVEKFYEDTNAADAMIIGGSFSDEIINDIKNHPLIDDVYPYFSFDGDVDFRDEKKLARINVINFKEEISNNKLTIIEGRLPNPDSETIEVVIEQKQPFLVDVPLGYITTFMDKTIEVVGIVHNPWYFAFVEEISHTEQRPIEIIVYADESLQNEKTYTNILITLNNSKKYKLFSRSYRDFLQEKIDILQKEYPELYFIRLDMNQSYAKYLSDVGITEAVSLLFPVFFLMVTVLVTMASMMRIVEDQRNQIGTLRSLGFGNLKILSKYIIYSLISSGLGTIIGIGGGVYFIPRIIYNVYSTVYNLPSFSIQYYFNYTSIISVIMIASVVTVTILSVYNHLNEKPTELLRPKVPKSGKKIFIEKIPFIWKRLKFKYKSTFRNIFRYKRNLFLTLIGIAGSTALLLAGFGVKDSVDLAGKYQYDDILSYDLEVSINKQTEISEIANFNFIYVFSMTAQLQNKNKDFITVLSFEDSSRINEFINFRNKNKKNFEFTKDSVIITKQFASKHNLSVGDKIKLSISNQTIELTITHIQDYYFGNNVYIAKEILEQYVTLLDYNKIYVITNLTNQEKDVLKQKLENNSSITKVALKEDLKYMYDQTSKSLSSIIIMMVVFSCALALVINYNLILINIHTRTREIATLKVLGYQEFEVSGYVFRETFIISLAAILIGILLGKTLHFSIISIIDVDGVILANEIKSLSYILTFILSLVFLGIEYFLSLPQTRKINMIEALKSYE